jgi:hypothetical protein
MSFLSPSRPFLRSAHWARLTAVGALPALVGALTIVVAPVAEDLDDMLMALAWVFVLAFSGWYVLTRRGPMRVLGVPGALLGPRDNLRSWSSKRSQTVQMSSGWPAAGRA